MWFGNWFGAVPGSGGGSPSPVVITSNPTTAEAIRDHMITLIEAITPALLVGDRFERYLNEREADFVAACKAAAAGALRRFQVRSTGSDRPPDVSNTDVESRFVIFEIMVAYPQTHRTGRDSALDRDDAMAEDQLAIEQAVGMNGYANFTGASNPNATWIDSETERLVEDGVEFLVIRQTMRFYRRMPS